MNAKEFYNRITNSKKDIIQIFLDILNSEKIDYCVIGGVAINAYCEPMITLDFDCIVAAEKIDKLRKILKEKGFKVKKHPHTIEITSNKSDIKIHIQIDKRYQEFIKFAKLLNVLGYKMKVATKKDLLIAKTWSYLDTERDEIKKEKDILDIRRLIKKYPKLKSILPKDIII